MYTVITRPEPKNKTIEARMAMALAKGAIQTDKRGLDLLIQLSDTTEWAFNNTDELRVLIKPENSDKWVDKNVKYDLTELREYLEANGAKPDDVYLKPVFLNNVSIGEYQIWGWLPLSRDEFIKLLGPRVYTDRKQKVLRTNTGAHVHDILQVDEQPIIWVRGGDVSV